MSKFTQNLDKLLAEKKITRKQFLLKLNLSKNSFSNWSERETLPNGSTLVKIADFFNIPIDDLIGRKIR